MNKKSWVFFYTIMFVFLLTYCGNKSSQTMESETLDVGAGISFQGMADDASKKEDEIGIYDFSEDNEESETPETNGTEFSESTETDDSQVVNTEISENGDGL